MWARPKGVFSTRRWSGSGQQGGPESPDQAKITTCTITIPNLFPNENAKAWLGQVTHSRLHTRYVVKPELNVRSRLQWRLCEIFWDGYSTGEKPSICLSHNTFSDWLRGTASEEAGALCHLDSGQILCASFLLPEKWSQAASRVKAHPFGQKHVLFIS